MCIYIVVECLVDIKIVLSVPAGCLHHHGLRGLGGISCEMTVCHCLRITTVLMVLRVYFSVCAGHVSPAYIH